MLSYSDFGRVIGDDQFLMYYLLPAAKKKVELISFSGPKNKTLVGAIKAN